MGSGARSSPPPLRPSSCVRGAPLAAGQPPIPDPRPAAGPRFFGNPQCQKKSQACGGPCPTGMACDPSTAQCGKPCTAGGNECGAPSPSQPWLSWT